MPYGDLSAMRVQRFGSMAGVDYQAMLSAAEAEADVIIWDGGNNDTSFVEPTVTICVTDSLRPDDGMRYHPGETNLTLADGVVINKVDSVDNHTVAQLRSEIDRVNPRALVVKTASPVILDSGPDLAGQRVRMLEDGPTVTHGGMALGAGTVAAREAGAAVIVDPRPWAIGSIAETFERYQHLGPVLPAVGYGEA